MLTTEAQLFASRLRQAMVNAGLKPSPTVLAQTFNLRYWGQSISVHAARNWLLGKSLPMQDKLVVLAQCLQVDASELRFGVAFSLETPDDSMGIESTRLQDRAMMAAFFKLPEDKRRLVRQLIHAL